MNTNSTPADLIKHRAVCREGQLA